MKVSSQQRPLARAFALICALTLAFAGAQMDSFQNPVLELNFPDPHLIRVDGVFYAYSTNSMSRNVPVARSYDLVSWELLRDALPVLPRWVNRGMSHVWAPEVLPLEGRFLLYYTARDRETDLQCIGLAVSDAPEEGFFDTRDAPLICQAGEGGSIDAHPFKDEDGRLYLYWKNDGNHIGVPSYLYVQELTPDGLGLLGAPTRLIHNDRPWEGRVVEAPTMWKHEGSYYLFYSANSYADSSYAVGYARCESPTGPCEKAPENPILASRLVPPLVIGPGHQTIILDDAGQTWLVYHAWDVTPDNIRGDRREVRIDRLEWTNGSPVVIGPTTEPQPKPVIHAD